MRILAATHRDLASQSFRKDLWARLSRWVVNIDPLRERLEDFRPEAAARITGIAAPVIRRFAREFAKARAALILSQFGMCKNYHSDLIQRS